MAISGRLNRDVPIKLKIMAHARAIRNLLHDAALVDVPEDSFQRLKTGGAPARVSEAQAVGLEQRIADGRRRGDFLVRGFVIDKGAPGSAVALVAQQRAAR